MTTYIPYLTLPSVVFAQPAISVLLPVVGGMVVGYATRPTETKKTYRNLKQPPLNPPAWVFGPVWTTLYAMMGYAAYRAWTTGTQSMDLEKYHLAKQGATLYTTQLALNYIWMPLFFGIGRPIEATVDILALAGTTGYLTYIWSQIDPVCGYLLYPYLAWLGFATYLCTGVGYLNNWNFNKVNKKE